MGAQGTGALAVSPVLGSRQGQGLGEVQRARAPFEPKRVQPPREPVGEALAPLHESQQPLLRREALRQV